MNLIRESLTTDRFGKAPTEWSSEVHRVRINHCQEYSSQWTCFWFLVPHLHWTDGNHFHFDRWETFWCTSAAEVLLAMKRNQSALDRDTTRDQLTGTAWSHSHRHWNTRTLDFSSDNQLAKVQHRNTELGIMGNIHRGAGMIEWDTLRMSCSESHLH